MFSEALKVTVTLAKGSETLTVDAGAVKGVTVMARPWGFRAEVTFWCYLEPDDPFFAHLTTQDLVKARIEVIGVYNQPDVLPDPLAVEGIVTTKRLVEVSNPQAAGVPIIARRYVLTVEDAAAALWRQHRPCELLADGAVADLLDHHAIEGMTLNKGWDRLKEKHPMLCLGLGDDPGGASFYDFLVWFCDAHRGSFTYDGKENKYLLAGAKPSAGTPASVPSSEVSKVEPRLLETKRHDARVLNASTASPTTDVIARDLAVAGVHRDVLIRTPVGTLVDRAKTIEGLVLEGADHDLELTLELQKFPTVCFNPNLLVKLDQGLWSTKAIYAGKTFRIVSVDLSLRAIDPHYERDRGAAFTAYHVEMRALLERKEDVRARVPSYVRPTWPIHVEGKIVSTPVKGDEEARSYQVGEDARTGDSVYVVNVVLWNQKINVPFRPEFFAPHFYFPAFKNSRVLLALDFDRPWIVRYLDWGPSVRLAAEGQGNHLLLGFNASSETSIRNVYVDDKSVFSIKRFDVGDQQLLEIKDGMVTWEVKYEQPATTESETYDVTLQVETAKAELKGKVGGGISDVTTKFGGAQAEVTSAVGGATSEVEGELGTTTGEVNAKADETRGILASMEGDLAQGTAPVIAKAEESKAAIKAVLE